MARLSIRERVERLLQVERSSKPDLYLRVFDSAEIQSLNYALELLFSAGIATLGLILNSPAVVIGAMLSIMAPPFSSETACSWRRRG